jgi:hypothetical protein
MFRTKTHTKSHNSARRRTSQTISALHIRPALVEAAVHATIAATGYAIAVVTEKGLGTPPATIRAIGDFHANTLVLETEDLVERWCELLGVESFAAYAPISWAMQEIVEWVDTSFRHRELGEELQRAPLTWRPTWVGEGPHDLAAIVDERLELLLLELQDYGVSITDIAAIRDPASRIQDRHEVA